jgi:hypothetical protein
MACKPGSVPGRNRGIAIHLGCPLPNTSRDRPGRRCGNASIGTVARPIGRPYLVLLQVGFTVPVLLPSPRCALTAPFHPYLGPKSKAVCFLLHCPWGRPRRSLTGTLLPWSPDFPRSLLRVTAAIRPSGNTHHERAPSRGQARFAGANAWIKANVSVSRWPVICRGRKWR